MSLLGAEGAVATNALVYLRISLLGVPALLVMLAGTGYLRGLQDTRTPLVIAVVSGLANLALEVVLIFGFGFGIGASALSTVVAQYGAAGVYVLLGAPSRARAHRRPTPRTGPPSAGSAGSGATCSCAPLALRGSFTVSVAVAARFGPVSLAAYSIAIEIWNLLALALDAIAIAGQSLVGRFLGASDVGEARSAGRRMLEWGVAGGVAMGVVDRRPAHRAPPPVHHRSRGGGRGRRLPAGRGRSCSRSTGWRSPSTACSSAPATSATWPSPWSSRRRCSCRPRSRCRCTEVGIGWLWAALGLFMATRAVTLGVRWRSDGWAVVGATR